MNDQPEMIAAIVMAAGLSRRMGRAKLILPWGDTTVIGRVVDILIQAGVAPVVVVTGGSSAQIEAVLKEQPVRLVFNPRYHEDQMALSLQIGLEAIAKEVEAVLVVLGDQPQIELPVVRAVIEAASHNSAALVVPSFQMRRGHPWLAKRVLFSALLDIRPPATLRDFLFEHAHEIEYLPVDNPSILQDLDTPEDYQRLAPE
jgi:molybdenum cofactor cytidylyltransferase